MVENIRLDFNAEGGNVDPNSEKVEIIAILDRSGSMGGLVDDVIGGYNSLIEDQKKVVGECLVTLTIFDHEYEIVYSGTPIQNVPKLTKEVYNARGGTALFDAVGRTINEVGERYSNMPEEERPDKVVVLINTDGQENQSTEFTQQDIAEMIERQSTEYSWEFIYAGANPATTDQARSIGFSANRTRVSALSSGQAYRDYSCNLSGQLTSYRSGADSSVFNSDN